MKLSLDLEFEKAVRLLVAHMPPAKAGAKKSPLAHDIRVGVFLYEHNYSREIVLAGVLHDALEWSDFSESELENEFGGEVLKIVSACSKNYALQDSWERVDEATKRCAANGKEALIVKTADTLDSFRHYTGTGKEDELEYCRKNAEGILKYMSANIKDPIFEELKKIRK